MPGRSESVTRVVDKRGRALTATIPFSGVATASVNVAVSKVPPVIHYFRADRAILCDARPVELSWKVCERAQVTRDSE